MKLTDNTLKYLKEYGGLSFGERPFSHVDSLILCQLSYFKFQDLVPDLVEKMDGNDIRGVTDAFSSQTSEIQQSVCVRLVRKR